MDLLGGYASDGSDASERSSDKHANETVQAENGPERALISAQDDDASELPSTSGNMVTHSLLSKLPAPKKSAGLGVGAGRIRKKGTGRITFSNRFNVEKLYASDDDDGPQDASQPVKKTKTEGAGGGEERGVASRTYQAPLRQFEADTSVGPMRPGGESGNPNDLYRVDESGSYQDLDPSLLGAAAYPNPDDYERHLAASGVRPVRGAAQAALMDEQVLERVKAEAGVREMGGIVGKSGQFKEISGADILGRASTQLDSLTSLKIAMGAEYQRKVRKEAGTVSKMENKKHQITSLYHHAKLAELEMLDMRSSGQKSRVETARKYSW